MQTNLAHALLALRDRRDLTLSAIAETSGLDQGSLSKLIGRARRPDVDTLCALCTKQPNPRDGLDLLLAHLRDEVERAGRHQTEVKISADTTTHEDDIRLLETQARDDSELRAILHDLAELVRSMQRKLAARSYPTDHGLTLHVAEEAPPPPRRKK
jgi:transcriptional regulator with XRE-family HTH domain